MTRPASEHAREIETVGNAIVALMGQPDVWGNLSDDLRDGFTDAVTALDSLASALAVVEQERDGLLIFAAEMSGLISDMGDVPDPGLDDLAGMAGAIRGKFERVEQEHDSYLAQYYEVVEDCARVEQERDQLREALRTIAEARADNPTTHDGTPFGWARNVARAALAVPSSEPAEEQTAAPDAARLAERIALLREDLETIAETTPHKQGCDKPDDPGCAACVAAAGLQADDELAALVAGEGTGTP